MSDKRLEGLVVLVATALVGVIVAGALIGSRSVAADLAPASQRALAAAGLEAVAVRFHGREAQVSGGTPDELTTAELVVAGVAGVRRVEVGPSTTATPTGRVGVTRRVAMIDLRRTATGIVLSGTVPDPDAAVAIKVAAAEDFAVPVAGDLTIDPRVGTADWVSRLPEVLGEVVGVKGLRLRIDGSGTISLSGSIESAAGADRTRELVAATVPELRLVDNLEVMAGDLTEADAAVLNVSWLVFPAGVSTLDADDRRTLDVVADVLRRNVRVRVGAGAHAAPQHPIAGARLGRARTDAVKAYLVAAGIADARVDTTVYAAGRASPADSLSEQFRRVDFIVKGS